MISIVDELKSQARQLQRAANTGNPEALARLPLVSAQEPGGILRRHCLAAIAKELGFRGWPHARAVLSGDETKDYGTLLYPPGASAHSNIWCASYEEARQIREQSEGFLLAYKTQFFIVDRYFIETIGLDAEDPYWDRIGRDWVVPKDKGARDGLYRKRVQAALANRH